MIDYVLDHKTSFSKFKTKILPSNFSELNVMSLEINYKKRNSKTQRWRLKTVLFSNQWVIEVKKEIKIYLETNENENTMFQSVWEAAKAVRRGKFMAIKAHLRKQEQSQVNNLTLHLKELKKNKKNKNKIQS